MKLQAALKISEERRELNPSLTELLSVLKDQIPKKSIIETPGGIIGRADVLKFLRAIPDGSIDLIATDPPYSGMNQHLLLGKGRIVGKYKDRGDGGKWFEEFHDTPENYHAFLTECRRVLKKDSAIFLMFDSYSLLTLGAFIREFFDVKNIVVWDKVSIGMGHYFRRQSEFIVYATKGKRPLVSRAIPDIWRIKRLVRSPYPTQKPVELFQAMIGSVFERGKCANKTVLDPFFGSGSSLLAAMRHGCGYIGCDVSEKAIALCKDRLKNFADHDLDVMQSMSAVPEQVSGMKKWW